jgi:hypothetical protein
VKQFKQIFSIFLAALMLALVFVPCKDNCEDEQHQINQSVQSTTEHHQEHNDICSPFCVCACCSMSATVQYYAAFILNNPLVVKQLSAIYRSGFSEFHYSIWQPPKLN